MQASLEEPAGVGKKKPGRVTPSGRKSAALTGKVNNGARAKLQLDTRHRSPDHSDAPTHLAHCVDRRADIGVDGATPCPS